MVARNVGFNRSETATGSHLRDLVHFLRRRLKLTGTNKIPKRPRDIRKIWRQCWYSINELAAHGTLALVIIGMVYTLQLVNRMVEPPSGMMLLDGPPPLHVPFDWALKICDLGAVSRFMWAGFKLFR